MNFNPWHLVIIAIVALLIFGPKRLPEFGRYVARMLREFKSGMNDAVDGQRQPQTGDSPPIDASAAPPMSTQQDGTKSQQLCQQCGSVNEYDSTFCRKCGAKLS